jgi:hypothetical protein
MIACRLGEAHRSSFFARIAARVRSAPSSPRFSSTSDVRAEVHAARGIDGRFPSQSFKNSEGKRPFSAPCGRSSLYSRTNCPMSARASVIDRNCHRFRQPSRSTPLKLSLYPFWRCASQVRTGAAMDSGPLSLRMQGGSPGVPVLAQRTDDRPAGSGLGERYHVHSDGPWFRISVRHEDFRPLAMLGRWVMQRAE